VTGLDLSTPMMERAQERARRLPRAKRPSLVRGDVRKLPFRNRTFQAVLAPYGLLQSLTNDADLDAALAEAARVMKPRGRLGIDLVPDLQVWPTYEKALTLRGRLGRAAVTLTESVRQDRRRGLTIFDEVFTTRAAGKTRRHRFQLKFRTIAAGDMLARVAAAGFRIDAVHGDYAGGPWTAGDDTWLILATKK
jgi:SAM-dependent methyltransferase